MIEIREVLFEMTAVDGTGFSFAVLQDEQCAILRNSDIVETHLTDDANLGRALKRYFKLIEECGGARRLCEAGAAMSDHPHAG
jgi:hypothetical protein